ncbi:Ankyrin-3 [Fusarium oxysporum f. sp. albedinis]|nr:Ankyrin-3 [Fusarium oxysporum f. sp. albedinis]
MIKQKPTLNIQLVNESRPLRNQALSRVQWTKSPGYPDRTMLCREAGGDMSRPVINTLRSRPAYFTEK